jgi:hypothetical protein
VRAHGGLVRCGACRGIFDAREHLIEGSLLPLERDDQPSAFSPQTIIAGMPAMGGSPAPEPEVPAPAIDHSAMAKPPEPATSPVSEVRAKPSAAASTFAEQSKSWNAAVRNTDAHSHNDHNQPADTPAAEAAAVVDPSVDGDRYRWRALNRPLSTWQKIVYTFLCLTTALALVAQSAYWFRDEIASRAPSSLPMLTTLCQYAGCTVGPPKRARELGFTSTELAADPAHKGLLTFTATLRNSGAYSVAYPSLVLTLEGASGEPISRRVFSPDQYIPANANLARGLEAGGDIEVKLYLDASPAAPVGFKVDHAYF